MNYPMWQIGFPGGLLIALIAVVHVFIAHFAVRGEAYLVLLESKANRNNDAGLLAHVRKPSKFFAPLMLVLGVVTGVGIWFAIRLVSPEATSSLIHTFVWGWAIEWVFFFVEIASILIYAVHRGRYGAAGTCAQRATLPYAAFDHVLGHGLARRLSTAERRDFGRDAELGTQRIAAAGLDEAGHRDLHSVGGQHSYCYCFPVQRTSRPQLLVDGDSAPRFLASAFAAGPSLLIPLCLLLLRRLTSFDVGREALRKLGIIVAYAMAINVFFVLLEIFTAFSSGIPRETDSFRFLFAGLEGDRQMVPWMWTSVVAECASLVLLLVPKLRERESLLALAAVLVFGSLWIEKGLGLILGGFVPSPLGRLHVIRPPGPNGESWWEFGPLELY
jgi:hypothetical protein